MQIFKRGKGKCREFKSENLMTFSSNAKASIRSKFPFFTHHPQLAWLDNAATTQKPQIVIDAIQEFYQKQNTNSSSGKDLQIRNFKFRNFKTI